MEINLGIKKSQSIRVKALNVYMPTKITVELGRHRG